MDAELIVAIVVAGVLVVALVGWLAARALRRGARAAVRATRAARVEHDDGTSTLHLDGLLPSVLTDPKRTVSGLVEQLRPQLLPALATDGTITLVFSDVAGSTALNVRLGDADYLEVIRAHDELARRTARDHRGRIVKSQGDGLMLAFKRPHDGVRFAVAFQRAVADELDEVVRVRVGVHTGEALTERGDFFGANVAFAARVADRAQGGEILVSDAVRDRVDEGRLDASFGRTRRHRLRGLPGRHQLTAVEW